MSTPGPESTLVITIVYENTTRDSELTAGWGFSALIQYRAHTVLFDTGADGPALVKNMATLHIAPQDIDAVVLSHNHWDHTGGLNALLATGIQPGVHLLLSFPAAMKQEIGQMTSVIETAPDQIISEGIFTTGEMNGDTPEQAIVIEVEQGIVIVTGCAHPGIVEIVRRVKELSGKPIYLVLGGFHLKDKTPAEIAEIVQAFRRLGVEHAGPCHCTGDGAIEAFAAEYGDDFLPISTGTIIEIAPPTEKAAG